MSWIVMASTKRTEYTRVEVYSGSADYVAFSNMSIGRIDEDE